MVSIPKIKTNNYVIVPYKNVKRLISRELKPVINEALSIGSNVENNMNFVDFLRRKCPNVFCEDTIIKNYVELIPNIKNKVQLMQYRLKSLNIGYPNHSLMPKVDYEFRNGTMETLNFGCFNNLKIHTIVTPTQTSPDELIYTKKVFDKGHNYDTISNFSIREKGASNYILNETKIYKDKSGAILRKEYITPSEVEGVLNIKSIDANNNETILCFGEKLEDGSLIINKNLESIDGTKTLYKYHRNPKGDNSLSYKIIDKDGNELLNDEKSFTIFDSKTALSNHNGKKYEIKKEGYNFITVKDLQTEELTQLDLNNVISDINSYDGLRTLVDNMNAEELLAVNKLEIELYYSSESLRASTFQRVMFVNKLSDFEHELGHEKLYPLLSDEDLMHTFQKEVNDFMRNSSEVQVEHLDYYLKHFNSRRRGRGEALADTNVLLNTANDLNELAFRQHYLQQYFPRTIAEVAQKMEKIEPQQYKNKYTHDY